MSVGPVRRAINYPESEHLMHTHTGFEDIFRVVATVVALLVCVGAGMTEWPAHALAGALGAVQVAPTLPSVDYGQADRTLLIFVRSSCHFCSQSMPLYRQLAMVGQTTHKFRTVFVDDEDLLKAQAYLANMGVSADQIASARFPDEIGGTPTVLLVDRQATVKGRWVGLQNFNGEQAIASRLNIAARDIAATGDAILTKDLARQEWSLLSQVKPMSDRLPLLPTEVRSLHAAQPVLIEFTDFECPVCGRYARDVAGSVKADYVDDGRLQYLVRQYPLEAIHEHAFEAAQVAVCAERHGNYWSVHDQLFKNQTRLSLVEMRGFGVKAGIDPATLDDCVRGTAAAFVRAQMSEGRRLGVSATPTFILGHARDHEVEAEYMFVGFRSVRDMRLIIDRFLGGTLRRPTKMTERSSN